MADNFEKRGTSAKGNISKGMRHSYHANFEIMVFKYAEQTTAKHQENTVSPRQTSKGGNKRSKNLRMSFLPKNQLVVQNMVTFMKLKNKLFSLYALKEEWNRSTCFM
jgi:hypothetical protein